MDFAPALRSFRRLLFGDLSRSLKHWKGRYAKSYYVFGGDEVTCLVEAAPKRRFKVTAGCYCNDPHIGGFSLSNFVWFYRESGFESREEAERFLANSVFRASRNHPDTRFVHLAGGGAVEEFVGSQWQSTEEAPAVRRCPGCAAAVPDSEVVCRKCGELVGT